MNPAIASVKARPLQLDLETSAEDAFARVIDTCLRHAEANLPAVRDGQIEGVHQMRWRFAGCVQAKVVSAASPARSERRTA